MLHALSTPVFRSIAVAALLLGTGIAMRPAAAPPKHRLVLHTTSRPDSIYLSRWMDGDVYMAVDPGKRYTFETYAEVSDGCRWVGIETLEPIDATHFAYSYDEEMLSCRPNARPCIKTPRTGIVDIE
jgi:hypothetical protein